MKKYKIEIKWAVLFTLVALLWMYFEKSMGWHDELISEHAIYTNFFSIVAIAVYLFALIDKRNNYYQGYMSWKEGFVSGLVLSAFVALLTPLSQWITHALITPDYFANAISFAVSSGRLTQEEAEAYFNFKSYLVQSFIFSFVVGAVTSAIVALFVKRQAKA